MHPAPSVIIFSTLSGLGFGLLVFLGLGWPAPTGWVAFVFFALAYILAVGGLIASTFHLGRPERALKAFTQWRTSWLSREGVCSVAALLVMAIYGAGLVFFSDRWAVLGWIGAALSLGTVYTTSMIYTSIRAVPRWNNITTPVMFLTLSLAGGALLAGQVTAAIVLLVLGGLAQGAHWLVGDQAFTKAGTTLGTATGLGARGAVRSFEPPHTGTNYLLKEFVYVLGRKHALKLRVIAMILMIVLPVLILLLAPSHLFAAVAVLSHLAGVATARWLFFAEAEHVVGLYYGHRRDVEARQPVQQP
ncbi:dimethyl sulfoxide reductase anchor subunit family protein [Thalassorhabdomicrobium marinisediminis]|uniref:Dibenzothiophene desulfurase n=1 Tax=Thalassorhabdomicrobium marinisediminis TaxID=2170577 RepID=A0A2T7FYL3_9RHOB|nr:DmsC/YnfH family molybdoenzyme membrane anchor subunit [Thalassorhabdomicrobium marinisediminis]PVA07257.1 dibenzothiophene desulfurase [Thalassorhabdomicrobium marinisediminis]